MSRLQSLNRIKEVLSIFSEKIKIGTSNQEFDDNIHSENIFCNVLNEVYGWNLKNMNYVGVNYPCIDLSDEENRIAVQITSTSTVQKVSKTLKCFFKNDLNKKYDQLFFYFIKDKSDKITQSKVNPFLEDDFSFNIKEHLLSKESLYNELNKENNVILISRVESLLEKELSSLFLNKVSIPKVGIAFSDNDFMFVNPIIKELIENKIIIYTRSKKVKQNLNDYDRRFIFPIERNIPKDIDYILVINTPAFIENEHNKVNKCPILIAGLKRQLFTFSYRVDYDTAQIPELEKYNNKITEIYNVQQSEILIKSFIEQMRTFEFYKIRDHRDILSILDNFEGGGFLIKDRKNNSSEKVAYEIYSRQNKNWGINQYVIYLYDEINQTKTISEIAIKHEHIITSNSLIVITPKPKLDNPDERKFRIASKLDIDLNKIFFVNEFLWERCTKQEQKTKNVEHSLSTFVQPYIQDEEGVIYEFNYIDDWLISEHNPILVVKGSGGIGKTTFAKYVANLVNEKRPTSNVVFVNSQQIVNELIKLSHQDEVIDLYKIYVANMETNGNNNGRLNQDLFRLNVDNGNILLIIDGLDEIISKLWKYFDINIFFQSIFDYTSEVGNGKVLITCRNYFWDKSDPIEERLESLEILPFDEIKARDFFKKNYPTTPAFVEKGIKLAKKLLGNNDEFIPFVLDQVKLIVDEKLDGEIFEDPFFESDYLLRNNENDYIIYQICNRETIRIKQIIIDEQIKFFIELAINGNISLEENKLDLFKAHPIVIGKENSIKFKYDFFESHFKNIYLARLLNKKEELNLSLINILANDIRYSSPFTNEMCSRLFLLKEELKYVFYELISEIENFGNISEKLKRKAISGLFIIALKKLHIDTHSNKKVNSELLKELFSDNGIITNLSIINFTSSDNKKIIFDFSNLKFKNCYFQNYQFFWECDFDATTYFSESYFFELNNLSEEKTSAKEANFDFSSCKNDEVFLEVLKGKTQQLENILKKIKNDLIGYLSIFSRSGVKTVHLPFMKVKSRYKRGAISFKNLHKILTRLSIVEDYNAPNNKPYIRITKSQEENVIKFLHDGTNPKIIRIAINEIKSALNVK